MKINVVAFTDTASVKESLQLVLDFMDHPVSFYPLSEVTQTPQSANADVVFWEPENAESVDALRQQFEQHYPELPQVLLNRDNLLPDSSLSELSTDTQSSNLLGVLSLPLKQQSLNALLQQVADSKQAEQQQHDLLSRILVGNSEPILQVRQLIEQVAKTNANVLVLGESGTGKEVVSGCIHQLSRRKEKPYVPVNCGAIPGELLESELFGHEKGAFTGAISARQGRFEMAQGGTLFLDEIGDMPLAMQVKLLRVLQERIFERVGSNKSIEADVRVIAATHRELENEVAEGRFREDLFYRLNVFPIEIPALRERVEDIPLLVKHLTTRMEKEQGTSVRLTARALASLMQHPWSGNVRELNNLIERLGIIYPYGVVDLKELPSKYQYPIDDVELPEAEPEIVTTENTSASDSRADAATVSATSLEMGASEIGFPEQGLDLKEHLSNLEQQLIQQALDEADGVVAHAAKLLKMRRTTLVEKMRKYGLSRAE